ncbi:MAG: cation diffusion facilitator family transporter [bacterium]|nr:cation diffusion facilitator family transporter [bacterium]
MTSRWKSPYVVMGVVLVMYAVKVIVKLHVGAMVHSPVITGDGAHNVADIVEALLVTLGIAIARMKPSEDYPFGRRNIESMIETAIGVGLLFTAVTIAGRSITALLLWVSADVAREARSAMPFLPNVQPLIMGPSYFWWVAGVTGGSALASLAVSKYQIVVGRIIGSGSLVADGQETRSDGRIEVAAFVGILAEYTTGAFWIEYPLALVVAFLVARTGVEILRRGIGGLLQRSLGAEIETAIREAVRSVHGVLDVANLTTFRVGGAPVVIIKVTSRASERMLRHVKPIVLERIAACLGTHGFREFARYVRFEPPAPSRHRIAYAIRDFDRSVLMAPSLELATHLRICDIEDGEIVRWKDLPRPEKLADALRLLQGKRVTQFFVARDPGQKPVVSYAAVAMTEHAASSSYPQNLGM